MTIAEITPADAAERPDDANVGVGQVVGPAAVPVDELAALEARKDAIAIELARLAKIDLANQVAEAALAQVAAEEQALDTIETDEWSVWIKAGAEGPAPAPHVVEREELARKRVTAVANLNSIRNAADALAARRGEINAELRRIDDEIFAIRVRELAGEAHRVHEATREIAAELVESAEHFDSIRLALIQVRGSAVAANDSQRAETMRSAIDAIEDLPRPALNGDQMRLDRAIIAVKARLNV